MLTAALQAMVRHASGLHLTRPTVARAARQRMREIGVDGLATYLARLDTDAAEMPALLELLVVPETWLFRDPEAFAAAAAAGVAMLRRAVIPPRPLRLLSLPCATGEEPYSLVMALFDAGLEPSQFMVDAIDISAAALAQAQAAVYRKNAFRNDDLGFRDRYFVPAEQGYQLCDAVRGQVRFCQANLLTMQPAPAPLRYDIIFCRNLLIYFDVPTQVQAIGILDGLLAEEGLLFAGYAELPVFAANGFATAQLPRAFALRRKAVASGVGMTAGAPILAPAPPMMPPAAAAARGAVMPPSMSQSLSQRLPQALPQSSSKPSEPSAPSLSPPLQAAASAQSAGPAASGVRDAAARSATDDGDPAALLAQARALADRGELAAAAAMLDACLRAAPESAPAHAMRGAVHAAAGESDLAERSLRRALYLDPQHYDVICQLAVLADHRGDSAGADTLRARAARLRARQAGSQARMGR